MRNPHHPIGEPITLPNGTTVPLSPGFLSGDFLFLSGQLAFNDDGTPHAGDIAEQTERCLGSIERLLSEAGLDRNDVVKVTAWLTNAEDFPGFNQAYAAFFADHRPARSTVCSQLLLPGARVEIEAVARIGRVE